MKKDSIKTIAGIAVIGIVVVATFLYGNAQRQTANQANVSVDNEAGTTGAPSATTKAPSPSSSPLTTPNQTPTNTYPLKNSSDAPIIVMPETGPSTSSFLIIGLLIALAGLHKVSQASVYTAQKRNQ